MGSASEALVWEAAPFRTVGLPTGAPHLTQDGARSEILAPHSEHWTNATSLSKRTDLGKIIIKTKLSQASRARSNSVLVSGEFCNVRRKLKLTAVNMNIYSVESHCYDQASSALQEQQIGPVFTFFPAIHRILNL
ncbi:hypothetical protein [Erythrobacter sp. SD-21]|uniref:hypothetical protein n=1 Tax=Erythrobacter sp. SD-21 TaxID=161528 RepID=UPI001F3BE328|nr:hypothetical protein [Erythrobacter sp. SD-21]